MDRRAEQLRRGCDRRGEIAFHGGLFVVGVVVYTVGVSAAALVLAVALLLTRRLPGWRDELMAAEPARGVRAWRGDWWFSTGVDAGLVVLGVVLIVMGVRDPQSWVAFTIPGAVVTGWFAVRLLLVATGRRRNEGIWLTDSHLVHDSADGRATVRREDVRAVVAGRVSLAVLVDTEVQRQGPPPGWRPLGRAPDREIRVDCHLTGPSAAQLEHWLRGELA